MEQVVIYLLMVQRLLNSKQEILKLWEVSYVSKTSKNFSVDNMKKTGLNGYVYDFSVIFHVITVVDILDIHKYLMEENGIV